MGEFEQIPEIKERIERSKMKLQENGYYWSPEWDSQSCADQDFVNNFKKGWLYQQSKIEQLQEQLDSKNTKPPLGKPFNFDLLDSYKEKIEQLEKRISDLQYRVDSTLSEINRAVDCCESIETECVLVEIKEILRGECD